MSVTARVPSLPTNLRLPADVIALAYAVGAGTALTAMDNDGDHPDPVTLQARMASLKAQRDALIADGGGGDDMDLDRQPEEQGAEEDDDEEEDGDGDDDEEEEEEEEESAEKEEEDGDLLDEVQAVAVPAPISILPWGTLYEPEYLDACFDLSMSRVSDLVKANLPPDTDRLRAIHHARYVLAATQARAAHDNAWAMQKNLHEMARDALGQKLAHCYGMSLDTMDSPFGDMDWRTWRSPTMTEDRMVKAAFKIIFFFQASPLKSDIELVRALSSVMSLNSHVR